MQRLRKTILVVDDEKAFVQMVEAALRQRGYDVVVAYDGAQALEKINSAMPDLVLLDIHMPKMSGLGVFNRLITPGPDSAPVCPVIVITANGAMEEVFKNLSVKGFLTKPLQIENMLNLVQLALTQGAVEPSAQNQKASAFRKILIIESDELMLARLTMPLLSAGYLVSAAASGTEAIDLLTRNIYPDLVLIRHDLEGSPLIQIAPYLRATSAGRAVSVMVYVRDLKKLTLEEESLLASYVGGKNVVDLNDPDYLIRRCQQLFANTAATHSKAA